MVFNEEIGIKKVLIVGIDLIALARSLKELGMKVYSSDFFGDQDLLQLCEDSLSIIKQRGGTSCGYLEGMFNPQEIVDGALRLNEKYSVDACLLSSGLEDDYEALAKLYEDVRVVGNSLESIRSVRDRKEFFRILKSLSIEHPFTIIVSDFEEAKRSAKDIGYPVMLKPCYGCGGSNIHLTQNVDELRKLYNAHFKHHEEFVVQEFVDGVPMSASILSTKSDTIVLTINRQLLGLRITGQKERFGYCGNIVPTMVNQNIKNRVESIAKKITTKFRLKGSNGIDFVYSSGKIFVIEVNPRFQGTLECVERTLNLNLVEMHLKACLKNELPRINREAKAVYTRMILYAPKRLHVPNLSCFKDVKDIPFKGVIVEEGEPLCSLITEGLTEKESYERAIKYTEKIFNYIFTTY